jgi:hypothetical protein
MKMMIDELENNVKEKSVVVDQNKNGRLPDAVTHTLIVLELILEIRLIVIAVEKG